MNRIAIEEERIRAAYQRRDANDARYSWFNEGHVFRVQQFERYLLDLLHRNGLAALDLKQILEVGCGTGHWLREFVKWGARPENVRGIDLLPDRVAMASKLSPVGVHIQCGSVANLPFPAETFDLILQSTVFTSILDSEMRRRAAAEILRVLKPSGVILWYDYYADNPWNPDVRGIKRREIYRLFPTCEIQLTRATMFPPLARALARRSYLLCCLLEKIPALCTHYVGVIRKDKGH